MQHEVPRRLQPGEGLIRLNRERSTGRAWFENVQFSYPLKLITPARHYKTGVHAVYVLSYGGGLVAGDRIKLDVAVQGGSTLVMLTQGSTKVFKTRPGRYLTAAPHQPKSGRPPNTTQPGPATDSSSPSKSLPTSDPPVGTHRTTTDSNDRPITSRETRQSLNVRVHSHSTCVLLPAPVTCFARARYSQSQKFALEDSSSSLIVLDWFTSGRMGMPTSGSHKGSEGEAWAFTRYKSTNEIWVQGQLQAKDVLLLEHEPPSRGQNGFGSGVGRESKLSDSSIPPPQPPAPPTSTSSSSSSSFVPRVAPYSAYATLLLVGPACAPVLNYLHEAFAQIEQPKLASPYALVWSFSKLPNSYVPPTTGSAFVGGDATGSGSGSGAGIGGVARCAGATTELVKEWVQDVLSRGGIEQIVSADMWKTAFG